MHLAPLLLVALCASLCAGFSTRDEYRSAYAQALSKIDWVSVKKDIISFFTKSQEFWPADFGNYGPFMIRQAWHCSGSYRSFDGYGGCDGGRQRFDPERIILQIPRSWEDNTNLDKAKTLLWPIKEKYGLGLSWGDLIILTGTTAIESMGGPVLGFCAGRIDDFDGSESDLLGPTHEQAKVYPCPNNGDCKVPFGTTTIGLIYVNPEGPMGQPNPVGSAGEVRDTFGRMTMSDLETVALIGGGHAFGKAHGACPKGAGPSPKEDPSNPWPGECGTGKGKDTFTSGFEGPWTTSPTTWGNLYFRELLKNNWEVHMGPGGHHQWRTVGGTQGIMMLTSDISLLNDPAKSYQQYVNLFATNLTALNHVFSHAWYKLVTRDMGPVTRCVGPWVPPPQPFQNPLPPTPSRLPDFTQVRSAIREAIYSNSSVLAADPSSRGPYYGAVFVHLAWQCSSTFRHSDYLGGCNGARIRFSPQKDWPSNVAMDKALQLLNPIQQRFMNLSWADLIVLTGTVALEDASGHEIHFCGGRTDASDGSGSQSLRQNGNYSLDWNEIRREGRLIGLTDRELVALSGRLRSPGQMDRSGFMGAWSTTQTINKLSNEYFRTLLDSEWHAVNSPSAQKLVYATSTTPYRYMTPYDLSLKWDSSFLPHVQAFAEDNELFLKEFISAWEKLMNLDRFDGPTGNVCHT